MKTGMASIGSRSSSIGNALRWELGEADMLGTWGLQPFGKEQKFLYRVPIFSRRGQGDAQSPEDGVSSEPEGQLF